MSHARRWLLALLVLLVAAISPIAFAAAVGQDPPSWIPAPLADFAFDVRLAAAPLAKKVISISRGSLRDKRLYFAGTAPEVRIASGDLQLIGSTYGVGTGSPSRPGVLLLHGSTPEGRRMGLYRILADALAERGYGVLTIDQRGYGQSPPAPDPARPDAYDYVGDAVRALAFLAALPGVDSTRLSVVGHSFGVGIALNAGLAEPRARSIVVMGPGAPGPPRPLEEIRESRYDGPPTGAGRYFARRAQRYGTALFQAGVDYIGQPKPLEALAAEELANPDHKPVLIVTDEFEPVDTRDALRAWQSYLAGPSHLLVAPGADHYLNTAGFGRLVIYDVRAVAGVVGEIDAWIGGSGVGCGVQGTCGWPGVSVLGIMIALVGTLILLVAGRYLIRKRSARGLA